MSSFAIYLFGFAIVIGGLAYGAYLLHVQTQWIVVGVIVLAGIGILGAVNHTRRRDPPPSSGDSARSSD
jgi:uncharacterized membrane protein